MAGTLEGGCSCGEVRYRLTSAPMFVHCCHCRNCQRHTGRKRTGAPLSSGIFNPEASSRDPGGESRHEQKREENHGPEMDLGGAGEGGREVEGAAVGGRVTSGRGDVTCQRRAFRFHQKRSGPDPGSIPPLPPGSGPVHPVVAGSSRGSSRRRGNRAAPRRPDSRKS